MASVASPRRGTQYDKLSLAQRVNEFPSGVGVGFVVRAAGAQEVVMDDSDRLSALRRELREQLGAERYDLWVGPHTELELDDGELRVGCSSHAEANLLRRRFDATLVECAGKVFGIAVATSFGVAASRPTQRSFFDENDGDRPAPSRPAPSAQIVLTPSNAPSAPSSSSTASARGTFDDFIVGEANQLAVETARDAAQQPGRFSPLLLHGPHGCGKSHLLLAIGHHARATRGRVRTLHLTAEQFTTQFLEALSQRALPGFRQKTRSVDLLLLDDVQFLESKKATLEELLYTIDSLQTRGGQAVLTSDRPVSDLHAFSGDLALRLSTGLALEIEPPDYAMRAGIVRTMAARMRISLSDAVVDTVAQQVVGSARLLSGAINRLVAVSMAKKKPITVELAHAALAEFCRQHAPQVRLGDIQRAVCEVFGVESASLKSDRKTRCVAEPRMLAMWLARRYTRSALSEIGEFFGRRSHSTVVSAQKKFDNLISCRGSIVIDGQKCQVEDAIRRIDARLRTG